MSYSLMPCPTEDSQDCYWDAYTAGNGQGTSFADIGGVQFFFAGKQIEPLLGVDVVDGVPVFHAVAHQLPEETIGRPPLYSPDGPPAESTPEPAPIQPAPIQPQPQPTQPAPAPIQPTAPNPIPETPNESTPDAVVVPGGNVPVGPADSEPVTETHTETSFAKIPSSELAETGGADAVGIVLAAVLIVAGFSAMLASRRIRKFNARLKD